MYRSRVVRSCVIELHVQEQPAACRALALVPGEGGSAFVLCSAYQLQWELA
jgi:hypothetical protein